MTQTVTQPVAVQADYQRIPGNKAVATVQGGQPAGGSLQGGEGTWGFIIGNIDNQADLMERLNAKVDTTTYQAAVPPHIADTNNPHQVTKAQVGLDQVDNTSDANKPMSNPTKTYIDGQVATLDNTKVAKAGDTMTGPLAVTFADTNTVGVSINTPNATLIMNKGVGVTQALVDGRRNNLMRWRVALGDATAESGLNAGSDYALNRYDDAGALIGTVYKVIRGSGQLQVIQNTATPALRVQALSTGNATIDLQKGAASSGNSIRGGMGSMTTGLRWAMHLGDGTAESGSNAGSNFALDRYSDAGAVLSSAFQIRRNTGAISFGPGTGFGSGGTANSAWMNLNKAGSGNTSVLFGTNNGSQRWAIELGSGGLETGSNAGSDFSINRYTDAGTFIDSPIRIGRNNGSVAIATASAGNLVVTANSVAYAIDIAGYYSFSGGFACNILSTNPNWGNMVMQSVHESGVWAGIRWLMGDPTSAEFRFMTDGWGRSTSGWTTLSDARSKTITAEVDCLALCDGAEVFEFDRKDAKSIDGSPIHQVGVIAQTLQAACPHLVHQNPATEADPDPLRAVDYGGLAAVAFGGVRAVHTKVKTLEERVADLESKLAAALDRITQLEGA